LLFAARAYSSYHLLVGAERHQDDTYSHMVLAPDKEYADQEKKAIRRMDFLLFVLAPNNLQQFPPINMYRTFYKKQDLCHDLMDYSNNDPLPIDELLLLPHPVHILRQYVHAEPRVQNQILHVKYQAYHLAERMDSD